jgi:predicted Zn-dependent protease
MTIITQVEAVRSMTNKEMVNAIIELQAQVKALTEAATTKPKTEGKEMTEDDARRVIFGDLSTTKHKDAADKLGLTYGQIYSARLGFTFKAIKEEGKTNPWLKK